VRCNHDAEVAHGENEFDISGIEVYIYIYYVISILSATLVLRVPFSHEGLDLYIFLEPHGNSGTARPLVRTRKSNEVNLENTLCSSWAASLGRWRL